ncbi:MAG: hypothetical protein A3K19_15110 [Lentisphaerae bacterium RIFOXYB12_FULL_65_16]|nr:MAG: hypothetical protein A3K18_01695 [Lentisphaerae bacterium RIFOXYA12_64_32]OGV85973.1 MAG: hypothetical protein A3K19_15110 [Lentisphaerae bacterium RIFOXYB12_FULL_65_16]
MAGSGALGQAATPKARAPDWSGWRGPNGTGVTADSNWSPAKLNGKAEVVWRANVGDGYSAISVSGKNVFTMGNRDGNDVVCCLSGGSGEEVWTHSYPCAPGSYPGPRATPVIDDGRVYAFSREGQLFCLEVDTGKVVWQKHCARDLKAGAPQWGFASSPVIAGELVLVNAGDHGAAFNRKTGSVVWASDGGIGNYSSAVLFSPGDKNQVAFFGKTDIQAMDLATGKKLWSFPWQTSYDVMAADPIVSGNRMFISSGYKKGGVMLDFAKGSPQEVWTAPNMGTQFSSCVLFEKHLYGIDGNAGSGALRCLDFDSGKEKWSQNVGFGSLIIADGKLIVLNEAGRLFVAEASPTGYKELAHCEALPAKGAKCWTSPVLCKGRLFLRNSKGDVVSIDVSK